MSTTPRRTMDCKELVELITDYLEGVLPPEERERFEEHLAGCSGCQGYMQQMQTTIRLTGKLTEDALKGKARKDLLSVYRKWKAGGS
jgi:predicted anti-sigma-YlaC factor YlaD